MKQLLKTLALATALAAPTSLLATPYCEELGIVNQLPKKYAKRGPFHVDAETGWIVGADQLKSNFAVTDEVNALWAKINAAFAAKGVKLVALVAPPRPLFAPNVPKTMVYDARKSKAEFAKYISALNDAGIVAPDLSNLADTVDATDYYFARDTHWTPKGAAVSAAMLAETLTGQTAKVSIEQLQFSDSYSEKGSLSTVVEKTCGVRPEAEIVDAPVYTQQGDASALLADASDQAIALVGTSFSNRYQRDTYQVAGAVSHALKASVDNFSVTGGGLVGAMEAFITGGALDSGRYKTVIWETPYTASLTNVSGLRQILGALHQNGDETEVYDGGISPNWKQIDFDFSVSAYLSIRVHTPGVSTGKLELEFYDAHGQKTRIKLIKSDRVEVSERSDVWAIALSALPIVEVSGFKVKMKAGVKGASIVLVK